MNLIDRVKNILITPKTEWNVIAGETATLSSLLMSYVLPLMLIPAASVFLTIFLWAGLFSIALKTAIFTFISGIIAYVVSAYVVDLLAANFKSTKDLGASSQLVAYSGTAYCVASVLGIIPGLGYLGMVAGGIYGIYLMYLGLGPVKKTPEDQKVIYLIITIVVYIVVMYVLNLIFARLFIASFVPGSMF